MCSTGGNRIEQFRSSTYGWCGTDYIKDELVFDIGVEFLGLRVVEGVRRVTMVNKRLHDIAKDGCDCSNHDWFAVG